MHKKRFFFFYLRLKTLTRHPLSGNEMIEYYYCKTRPLKILTVCSQDTPEQDTSLVESPFIDTDRAFKVLSNSAAFTPTQMSRFKLFYQYNPINIRFYVFFEKHPKQAQFQCLYGLTKCVFPCSVDWLSPSVQHLYWSLHKCETI